MPCPVRRAGAETACLSWSRVPPNAHEDFPADRRDHDGLCCQFCSEPRGSGWKRYGSGGFWRDPVGFWRGGAGLAGGVATARVRHRRCWTMDRRGRVDRLYLWFFSGLSRAGRGSGCAFAIWRGADHHVRRRLGGTRACAAQPVVGRRSGFGRFALAAVACGGCAAGWRRGFDLR